MDFAPDDRTSELVSEVRTFLDELVLPAEPRLEQELRERASDDWRIPDVIRELRSEARARGLWNLFLPGEHGAGLTNLQYAPIAELSGRSPKLLPAAMNCNAPDSGNMELLALFGTDEQKAQWLEPLLRGEIRSAFAMTEPQVASSDATNIETRITRDGDEYIISGRKWWCSGAMSPETKILVVMGKTDPDAPRHRQQSQILVPRDAPGVEIVRPLSVFGYDDRDHGGHAEIAFHDVRVPATNIIVGEGEGFAIAQARLGPGRIHHCMRLIGMAERALEMMLERSRERVAFGRRLADQGGVRVWVAEARIRIEMLRLLVLKTAWLMDTVGNRAAHTEIQAIKIEVPRTVQQIIDDAIQLHGGIGVSADTPLAELFAQARSLRLADGPDEVHLQTLGRALVREP